ncbi:polysaccharide lyase family 7 protein [Vulgatibacter sp.]|uniref:polysaccharide lyase family 7 protein n=1 Tax=Vulgatibacter sp. TaxID=1971226 RepID=UPI003568F026
MEPQEPAPTAELPADRLDLSSWKLTLPVETPHEGDPDEIRQPELADFAIDPFFGLTAKKDGVVFRAPVEGATTSGSGYPRSELREMTADGSDEASWSTTSGTHTLEIRQAITHLPEVKAHVVAGQIHDAEDDVIMIRLEGEHLFVEGGGEELATLDANYQLGTVFTVKMVASDGRIRVHYDDVLALDLARAASGCYFKAGAYTQSNLEKGDVAGAYGEVVIYDLQLAHD